MATIAKLDSNGVQVLPEGQRGKTTSPQVSSTDFSMPSDRKYSTCDSICMNKNGKKNLLLLFSR